MKDILIVEDDSDAAGALADALSAEGYHVRVGFNGQQGLTMLDEQLPDLVVLDVEMPVLDGPGMVFQMIAHNAGQERIPVVLFTGRPDAERIAAEVGTPYLLTKPANYEQLMAIIERAIGERVPPKPSRGLAL